MLVAVGENIRADRHAIAGEALDGELAVIDRRFDRLDGNAGCGGGFNRPFGAAAPWFDDRRGTIVADQPHFTGGQRATADPALR